MSRTVPQRRDAPGAQGVSLRRAEGRDLEPILNLLRRASLPTAGVADHIATFWVAEFPFAPGAPQVVATGGLEVYPPYCLLRSVAVEPEFQGRGIARLLVQQALEEAARRGCRQAFLLTTTAEAYFARLGWERRPRQSLPRDLEASAELRGACPATAAAMGLELDRLGG
ncbi:MAG: arsenic resistance N-acetyltransferase ArsN2 [Acetobacteraceae bacterium]|nr:arsenic resistance N-acetyltransferase ArsN2 [Acetobacteraceae bacterium]